jgi:hypothetical protein
VPPLPRLPRILFQFKRLVQTQIAIGLSQSQSLALVFVLLNSKCVIDDIEASYVVPDLKLQVREFMEGFWVFRINSGCLDVLLDGFLFIS